MRRDVGDWDDVGRVGGAEGELGGAEGCGVVECANGGTVLVAERVVLLLAEGSEGLESGKERLRTSEVLLVNAPVASPVLAPAPGLVFLLFTAS